MSEAGATTTTVLSVRDLCVGYSNRVVVSGLTLDLEAGRTIAMLGINGAGKSTALKGIAGAIVPKHGRVELCGDQRSGLSASQNARAGLVLVPEGAKSFYDLSVLENLEMGGFVVASRALLRERLDEVLSWFPRLKERLYVRAGSLSGGERQMLGIARALMLRPKVLLLDEPFLGLAPIMVAEVKNLIELVQAETDCGIILAEQQVNAVLPICSQALVLREGVAKPIAVPAMLRADEAERASILFGVGPQVGRPEPV